jgi:3,4-dihydroxy 2-butanone 4-phosphate synthase/GTP cyclohydrolase II
MVPLVVGVGEFNEGYLDAKRDRMGHALPTHEVLDQTLADAALQDAELQSLQEGNS